jgi:DNA polymerase
MTDETGVDCLDFLGISRWERRRSTVVPMSGDSRHSGPGPGSAPENAEAAHGPPAVPTLGWEELARRVAGCESCGLCRTRQQTVFGAGLRQADWMFVGEAPGADEDREGQPFVGRAGQLLTSMIEAMGLERRKVYIANVLKCRPPRNRDPDPVEIASCRPFLDRQIALVAPRILVALGRIAAQSLLATDQPLSRLRGTVHSLGDGLPLIVTYHPAYLLRNPVAKRETWRDLCLALERAGC